MVSIRGLITILTVLLLVILVGIFLTGNITAPDEQAATVAEIFIVQAPSSRPIVEADGIIEPETTVNLSFLINGQIRDLYISDGDYVEAGTPLVALDNERQRVALARSEVMLQINELQRDDLLEVDADDIALAEARLESTRNTYGWTSNQISEQDIASAEINAQIAAQSVTAAEAALQQGGGDMVEPGVDLLEAQIGEATFNAEIARLQAQDLRTASQPALGASYMQIQQAEAELERVKAGASEYQITAAELAVDAMNTLVEQSMVNFDRTVLVAPSDGYITNLDIEVGQQIEARDVIGQLVDIEPLHALVDVDEIDLRNLAIGQDVVITLDAYPDEAFAATITRISENGVEKGGIITYETEAVFVNADAGIRPGMTAKLYLVDEPATANVMIPQRFVQTDDTVLVAQDDGTLISRSITTGATQNGNIEIVSGLQVGDALVLAE